ncbi:hypothetical protein HWI92_10800 [Dyadobacter sandarakinus]|uniref:Uncharacterized protein n=2 Tax=Dyadobacter sandarakinus TaxID=2747268 RepID=A0ABX7IEA4_9BACT|nr:hypothetical protein HWI92_10800 [Dyadobacter sandarakinus]
MFREAGMQPVNHILTKAENERVSKAFALLPPLHQRILRDHLFSISFMDNMPNTALTSPVDSVGGKKMFNITFRAGILNETISEWATWKENSCFKPDDTHYKVHVEAGTMDAFLYVLLHESTHVLDAMIQITPHYSENDSIIAPTPFTKEIWRLSNVPEPPFVDSLLEQTRFRSGKPVSNTLAPEVYARLSKTPFPSLYATAAWSEDIAELATIYHMTSRLKQPYYIVVTRNNVEVARFEPMKNALVRSRLSQLSTFYK